MTRLASMPRLGRLLCMIAAILSMGATAFAADIPARAYPHRSGPLSAREMGMARIAWKYFENNTQSATGLVNAVDGYPSTTMWDTASYLGALVAARELGIIDKTAFDRRLTAAVATLGRMPLFRDQLPNKAYDTTKVIMVDYGNKPGENGVSALDIGRLLIVLSMLRERYPEHGNAIDRVVLRWDFRTVVDNCGTLFGALVRPDKSVQYVQEGRLGYEEYAAAGYELWGFNTCLAAKPEPYAVVPIYCVNVPYDSRDPREFSQHNYVVAESYVLDGIELGWDLALDRTSADDVHTHPWMEEFAHRVYQAQENRHRATGKLTARSEHQLDRDPYFVYDTVYSDGYAWNTITDTGKYMPQFAAISLKAALGMWALWKSPYTDLLFEAIVTQNDPAKGYYEGVLENGQGPIKTFTANNNGIMLEALAFKQSGKLHRFGSARSLWTDTLADPIADNRAKGRPVRPSMQAGDAGSNAAQCNPNQASCQCSSCNPSLPAKPVPPWSCSP